MGWVHRLTDIDPETRTASCSSCGEVTIRVRETDSGGIKRWRCSPGHPSLGGKSWARRQPVGQALLQESDGTCDLCGAVPDASLHVDHDHRTNEVRGLLCRSCNVGLGHFKDDPELLKRAITYLTAPPLSIGRR